jgi:hypothetical protein
LISHSSGSGYRYPVEWWAEANIILVIIRDRMRARVDNVGEAPREWLKMVSDFGGGICLREFAHQ